MKTRRSSLKPAPMGTRTVMDSSDTALLRLLQLVSPALPVGAYAYSQGLEHAVAVGWVHDEQSAADWISGVAHHALSNLDLPVFARLCKAWQAGDDVAVARWNAYLYASRESAELQQEDRQLGLALARLLSELEIDDAANWRNQNAVCFATMFSLAAVRWGVDVEAAACGYLWTWWENQVAAAIKLIPLGQTAGQRILSAAAQHIPDLVGVALAVDDQDIGAVMPALAIGSAQHEVQYSRMFRS